MERHGDPGKRMRDRQGSRRHSGSLHGVWRRPDALGGCSGCAALARYEERGIRRRGRRETEASHPVMAA